MGYPDYDASWEPAAHLTHASDCIADYWTLRQSLEGGGSDVMVLQTWPGVSGTAGLGGTVNMAQHMLTCDCSTVGSTAHANTCTRSTADGTAHSTAHANTWTHGTAMTHRLVLFSYSIFSSVIHYIYICELSPNTSSYSLPIFPDPSLLLEIHNSLQCQHMNTWHSCNS